MDSLKGVLLLIAVAVIVIAGLRLLDYGGHFAPKEGERRRKAKAGPTSKFDEALGKVVEGYVEQPRPPAEASSEDRFRAAAPASIEPLLNSVVAQAQAGGHTASFNRTEGDRGLIFRLEIQRSDHPADEPVPYVTLAAGKEDDVAVVTGGTFPGPRDENGHRTEIDWYETSWRRLDDELLKFTRRVFRHFAT